MKKMIVKYWVWFIVMFMVAPVHAQQYDDLWKEAEELQKKDLPQSVIAVANRLVEKATAEKNTCWLACAAAMPCKNLRLM